MIDLRRYLILLCALGLLISSPAAQTTTATLEGRVADESGVPVDGAVVQAQSVATGLLRAAVTDADGVYRIDLLQPGRWRVFIRAASGEARTVEIDLKLQETRELDFTADVLTESVTVTAEAPLLDPQRTTGESRLTGSQSDALPVAGRVISDLALLDASVSAAPPGNYTGERGSVFTVNGQSGRSNSFLVDGVDNNDQTSGTSLNSFFSQLVIQEFVVMTHQFAPEFGRASGGVLNIVTRQGGNEFAGEAFVQGSADRWNSTGELTDSVPIGDIDRDASRRFQTGFSLGGPMKKDKAFYFMAFEHQEAEQLVPFTGLSRDGTFGGRFVAPSDSDNFFLRTDFVLNDKNFLMLRLSADDRSTDGVNVLGIRTPESGFRLDEQDIQLAGSWTSVLKPNLFHELRFLIGDSTLDQQANSDLTAVSRPTGVFGGNQLNRQDRDEFRVQIVDNLTWSVGDHDFKFGADVTWSETDISTRFNPNGGLLYATNEPFEPGDCGDLLFNQVLEEDPDNPGFFRLNMREIDCPGVVGIDDDGDGTIDEPGKLSSYPTSLSLVVGEPEDTFDDWRFAVFLQDSWQATPRFQLDYGVRYDLSTYELPGAAAVASTVANGGARRDTDNLAPRLGFSWTPGAEGRWIVRGGGGVFYDKLVLAFPAVAAITSQAEIQFTFPQGLTVELDENIVDELGIDVVRQFLATFPQLTLRFSTGSELETPYTVQWNAGIERSVGKRGALTIDAVRALGYHTPLFKDLNPVVATQFSDTCPESKLRRCAGVPIHAFDDGVGSIASLVTEGRTWYSALELGFRRRGDAGWFTGSYTWSKSDDLGFDPLKDGVSLPPDSFDILGERGRADSDRRHRLILSGESALPWFGLRGSAVVTMMTGAPFNIVTGMDDGLDGFLNDRPAGLGRNTGEDTPIDVINSERADLNDEFGWVPGDADYLEPVAALEEPDYAQFDVRIWKPFAYGGGNHRGQFFLQVFNLFDRQNGGLVDGRIVSPTFGRVVGQASPPRTFEAGARFGF